jgi:2-haloacid dehalogenase
MDFSKFDYLTFDCYGTLIDWEAGILAALRPILAAHVRPLSDNQILETYAELESAAEHSEYRSYREILKEVVRGFGKRFGFNPTEAEQESLPNSVKNWPPFPDTVAALARLATRYKLCVISNIDDDLFAESEYHLTGGVEPTGVHFAHVITAQQCRTYKPSLNNFAVALDIAPAQSIGLATAWINRRKDKQGSGATTPANAIPDLELFDLHSLADLALDASTSTEY